MNKHLRDFRKGGGQSLLTQWTWKTELQVLTLLLKYTFHSLQMHCPPSDPGNWALAGAVRSVGALRVCGGDVSSINLSVLAEAKQEG